MNLKTFIIICLLSCMLPPGFSNAKPLKGSRPNLIVVMRDDQGYGDLSCNGHPHIKKPLSENNWRKTQANQV